MIEYNKNKPLRGFSQIEIDNEEWRDIEGYEGLYQVSSLGRVKGLPRKVNNHTGYIQLKERYIKGHPITKGYLQIQLSIKPKRDLKLIHVLVAQAFIPNPKGYPQVNHINGVKTDNRVTNLEWCDNSMNQLHAYKMGLNKHSENSGRAKRPVRLVDKKGKVLRFPSIADAERFLDCRKSKRLSYYLNSKNHNKTINGYRAYYEDRLQ